MKILVIDDDRVLNKGICTFLQSQKYEVIYAFDGKEGTELIAKNNYDLVLSDLQMPVMDGMEVLNYLKENALHIPVIIMTAFASVENAVDAMKKGAEDYLTKPVNLRELAIKIEKIKKSQKLLKENISLKEKISSYEMPDIIGESEAIQDLKTLLRRIAKDSSLPVSIYGKSGTGKELIARNIHFMSDRKDKPFIPINCAVLSDELMESELFGHVKGAFTGAINNKVGLIESCDGGTLFLDEISEMSPRVQSKLLRVLQDKIIQPVGSNTSKQVDVRIISASNLRLADLVEEKKFRDDLYFRLNIIEIEIPSLAARRSDIPLLIEHFMGKYDKTNIRFHENTVKLLMNYSWPGNVRELENLIRMLAVMNSEDIIMPENLPDKYRNANDTVDEEYNLDDDYKTAYNRAIQNFEKAYIEHHLKKNNYNISKTSEEIKLSRVSLHKKINEYDIDIVN
ncbi:Nitrogen regulation protein NR(I) [hydrothermal vent metagenome]|uniref:Nitrogen regulation protein NR(I) n=1 Tax=hydrothermal vent metagenome TaxID=652676 RepID=A0A3B1BZU6_9ZZZZ